MLQIHDLGDSVIPMAQEHPHKASKTNKTPFVPTFTWLKINK